MFLFVHIHFSGCAMQFRGREDDPPVYARVVYQDTLLRVYLDTDGEGEFGSAYYCFGVVTSAWLCLLLAECACLLCLHVGLVVSLCTSRLCHFFCVALYSYFLYSFLCMTNYES